VDSPTTSLGFGTKSTSHNTKTGKAQTTYLPVGETCPDACPLKATRKCYAMTTRNVYFQQRRAAGETFDVLRWLQTRPRGSSVRHMVSGDWFINDGADLNTAYIEGAKRGHASRPDLVGWSYTHGWRGVTPDTLNGPGLCVNASTESEAGTRQALAAGWAVAQIVDPATPPVTVKDNHAVVVCPQQASDGHITCDQCHLCAKPGRKYRGLPVVVGFRAHSAKRQVMALIQQMEEEAE